MASQLQNTIQFNELNLDEKRNQFNFKEGCSTTEYETTEGSETESEDELIPELANFKFKRLDGKLGRSFNRENTTLKRRPTRKPDPNTCNRNALMARENRKKKKEYVEQLEKNIAEILKDRKNLRKIVKKQARFIEQLKNEKRLSNSFVSNNSETLNSFVNSANNISLSPCYSLSGGETPQTSYTYSSSECKSNSFTSETPDLMNSFEDLNGINGWEIFDNPIMDYEPNEMVTTIKNINEEHNYNNAFNT